MRPLKTIVIKGQWSAGYDSFRARIDCPFIPESITLRQLSVLTNDDVDPFIIQSDLVDDPLAVICPFPQTILESTDAPLSAPSATNLVLDHKFNNTKNISGTYTFRRVDLDGTGVTQHDVDVVMLFQLKGSKPPASYQIRH